MDPYETLMNLLAAFDAQEHECCLELIHELRSWLERGGFAPQLEIGSPARLGKVRLSEPAARTICLGICTNIESAIAVALPKPTAGIDPAP